jgi:hypothetical protein
MSAAKPRQLAIIDFPDAGAYFSQKSIGTKPTGDVTETKQWAKWNGSELEFTLAFQFDTHAIEGSKHEVTITLAEFKDALVKKYGSKAKRLSFDIVHVSEVVCTDFQTEFPLSVEIFDFHRKPMFIPTCLKKQVAGVESNIVDCIGPILNEKSKNNKKLYECNEPISIDQIRFGDLTMDKITANVQFVNIGQSKYAIIPKEPNGVYFYWALTVQNPVFPDDVCNIIHTKWDIDESNFKLEYKMYCDVLTAYEKNINAQQLHCLKHIKVSINSLLEDPQKTENSTLLFFKFTGLFHPHNTEPSGETGGQNPTRLSHRSTASESGSETDSDDEW